jgi:hypothetical protein
VAVAGRASITRLDVTPHRLPVRPQVLAAGTTPVLVATEARRLGGQLAAAVRRPAAPAASLIYGSERQLLGYAATSTDFFIVDLPKQMRAYDRRGAGVALPILTINGFQLLRMSRRRSSGHVTGSLAESMCVWTFNRLGIATGRDFRRISQTVPGLIGEVCPDFLLWRQGSWVPCESKHVVSERYLRRSANRGLTQILSAMAGLGVTSGYLFVAIDAPASGARYRAELVELYV